MKRPPIFGNSGIFVCKASVLYKQYKKYLPETYESLKIIKEVINTAEENLVLEAEYERIEGISIDYGILEKSKDVYVMECSFHWDDIGNWTAMKGYMDKDEFGNYIKGDFCSVDSKDCIVYGGKRLIATVGINDLIM